MLKFITDILQLIIAPEKGWEDIARHENENQIDIRQLYLKSFLPLIAVCSASSFIRIAYDTNTDFLAALQFAIINFISLFLSYHISIFVFSSVMQRLSTANTDNRRGSLIILFSIAIIGLIILIGNIIKIKLALIQFLPFYVIYIIWKGTTFIDIDKQNTGIFMLIASASIVGSVYLLSFLFSTLI